MGPKKAAERQPVERVHPSMEPVVRDGKIREQIELESKVRQEYQKKWGFINQPRMTEYFDLKKNNQRLKELHQQLVFVSRQMFKTLLDTCRCGRKKVTNSHALKCLQKSKSTYEKTDDEEEDEEGDAKKVETADTASDKSTNYIPKVPPVSSGMYGWPQNRFVAMEKTTYYISPRYTMPGHPIVDSHPYSAIILG
ncbi:conserved hypothetical protein [Culex quinquefasciatus]|uniref:Uncharacterized protein n=1 Tax=Culex quinquefasciatus TaxID=7176 RepID=B0WT57_CULQU|nr:conserved hypothetical protein [Culex quinquefasciatus]|eukprot:XP_001870818.1 conserved hypothetical protein [Culex quinquefasciatus]